MNTHDKALSELVNADVQYDSHSDEWCLRPGCPVRPDHLAVLRADRHLADTFPRGFLQTFGVVL